jgi:glutamate-1-semialdehyde 2,1-aminomutase
MGMVKPVNGFLEALRRLTQKAGALLIFDEVMTGFRVAYGGAQALLNIMPDLTCLGKIIGGGMPVGAYGGSKEVMSHIAPQGPVYQAGTLSGNPVAMAAGIATLGELQKPGFYEALDTRSERLLKGLEGAAAAAGIDAVADRAGSMMGLFFTKRPVNSFADAKTSDLELFSAYYKGMMAEGIYLAPSQFEALFVSAAHSEEDIDATVQSAEKVLKGIRG